MSPFQAKPSSELREAEEERIFWGGGHQTKHKKQHCLFCSEIESLINLKIKETSRKQNNFMLDTMDLFGSLDAPTLKVLDFGLDRPEWVAWGLALKLLRFWERVGICDTGLIQISFSRSVLLVTGTQLVFRA